MAQLFGLLLVILMILGALLASGGQGVMAALPFEFALIAGAALGTLFIGNSTATARAALGGFAAAVHGSRWHSADYLAALTLIHGLIARARKGGLVAIEDDIERPNDSALFAKAPQILSDTDARDLICDTFRLMALDLADPARAEIRMERAIDLAVDRRMKAVSALHTVADALPALGIVAAVLGIIKTMGVIDQSPAVLGAMIATALLGTFLGVFLAYGVVGPVASRFGQVVEEDAAMLETIRSAISSYAAGLSPRAAVELARASVPADHQPGPDELDRAIQAARFAGPRPALAA